LSNKVISIVAPAVSYEDTIYRIANDSAVATLPINDSASSMPYATNEIKRLGFTLHNVTHL